MKGVLVIEGHVQGLSNTRSLGEFGIPVWVLDTGSCLAQQSKYCKNFLLCPAFDTDEFVLFLVQIAREYQLDGWLLLPSNDHAVYSISKQREKLSSYYSILTDKIETINKIYNKIELLNLAKSLNIPFPPFELIKTPFSDVNLNFPVLTKGNNGLSFYKKMKRKVVVSNNMEELTRNLQDIQNQIPLNQLFTQELIPSINKNKTISFTAFSINGRIKTHWVGKKLREHPLQFGTATLAESIVDPGLFDYSSRLLQALNYTGICEIEFLKDERDQQYKLIEMNARTWLWVELAKECGVNYAKLAYDFVQDSEVDFPTNYKIDVVWYNPFTNMIFTIKGILFGKIPLEAIWMNPRKVKVNALFKKEDPFPFLRYFMLGIKFLKKR